MFVSFLVQPRPCAARSAKMTTGTDEEPFSCSTCSSVLAPLDHIIIVWSGPYYNENMTFLLIITLIISQRYSPLMVHFRCDYETK